MEESVLERKLYYVPVFHDPIESDIGEYEHNKVFTEHFRNAVHDLWNFIESKLDAVHIDKLYQDSYTGDNFPSFLVLSSIGSRNCEYLLQREINGATLIATESKELLNNIWELPILYYYIKFGFLKYFSKEVRKKYTDDNGELLNQLALRDRFIAERINETLKNGETGVLFCGATHNVDKEIMEKFSDINVIDVGSVEYFINKYPEIYKILVGF